MYTYCVRDSSITISQCGNIDLLENLKVYIWSEITHFAAQKLLSTIICNISRRHAKDRIVKMIKFVPVKKRTIYCFPLMLHGVENRTISLFEHILEI